MKFITKSDNSGFETSNPPLSLAGKPNLRSKNLAGFTKVLVDGKVVGVDNSKTFRERMIGRISSPSQHSAKCSTNSLAILESVSANLEAGMKLLDKQELSLAKIGGKLSEIALALNQARDSVDKQPDSQERFVLAREDIRRLTRSTFDHTVLFSNAPSKPIVVAVPTLGTWEGLTIDRCDMSSPGFTAIELGKVSPNGIGYLLDPESVSLSFEEWRRLCIHNRLQWSLLSGRLFEVTHFLMDRAETGSWLPPSFPENSGDGPLRRPHRNN